MNVYEYITLFNDLLLGNTPATEGIKRHWAGSVANKDGWKRNEEVLSAPGLGARANNETAVRTGREKERTYDRFQFQTYAQIPQLAKKITDQARTGGNFEQKAFNWIWADQTPARSGPTKNVALKQLQDRTNPKVVSGTYWDRTKKKNFSIIEQMNYYNAAGFNALRGTGIPEIKTPEEARDFMFRNKTHIGLFIRWVLMGDDKQLLPALAHQLHMSAENELWHPRTPEMQAQRRTELEGVPVYFDHMHLAFIPLDALPRRRLSKAEFLRERGSVAAMQVLVDGYGGKDTFKGKGTKLWPLMQQMKADLARAKAWEAEDQMPPQDEVDPDFMGAVRAPPPLPKPKPDPIKSEEVDVPRPFDATQGSAVAPSPGAGPPPIENPYETDVFESSDDTEPAEPQDWQLVGRRSVTNKQFYETLRDDPQTGNVSTRFISQ